MKYVNCQILDGDSVIAEDVDVVITKSISSYGAESWLGNFELPFNVAVIRVNKNNR